jgi:hypothetical protein
MIHARHGMYESAQMDPADKQGSVEEIGNTVVDVMEFRDEMIMKGGGARAESKMWERSVGEGNSNGGFSDVIQVH